MVKLINFRFEQYKGAQTEIRQKIIDYFFTKQNETKLLEVMGFMAGHTVQAVDASRLLSTNFDSLEALTSTVLNSGLGLELQDDFFIFSYTQGLKEDRIVFMKQLAHALNAYRTCCGLGAIYDVILHHQHVQTQAYETYLPAIEELTDYFEAGPKLDEELSDFLSDCHGKAVDIQKKMAIQHNEVNVWKDSFTEMMQRGVAVICEWLHKTGGRLIKATTEFSDNSWLGSDWRPFIVSLINQLFAGYYNYSWWVVGSVGINSDYFVTLTTELAQFSLSMQDKMEHLKLALLGEANGKVNHLIQTIQAHAALNTITLAQPPTANYSQNIYGLMFCLSKFRAPNGENCIENTTPGHQFQ
ncbi:hypothetical protein [Legionella antarctica]|uniref:hypothetical protein n=1 Tax=Legionella antarctica TaxID=2708020 RepID=UPI0015642557|nr:hypothetical protein [Legionella antarctica]